MYLLFPGRHQLLTNFQFNYLNGIAQEGLVHNKDVSKGALSILSKIEAIVFAVTSANHSNTRRNPLPFHQRVMQIEDFADDLPVPTYTFGVDEVGHLDNFASYTIKRINHESEGLFQLSPENTVVVCSTPVMGMYEKLGYKILSAELMDRAKQTFSTEMPWDLVEMIAFSEDNALYNKTVLEKMHPASLNIWQKYRLAEKVQLLFKDHIISDDGDITTTRDYNSYVRQMDEIAELKFSETMPYIRAGRIGDIGCAVGSWIKLATQESLLRESDFYGIEVARHLFDICQQRKHNGEFQNPYVFFAQKNAVTGLVFNKNSMQTIHTSSLTHEIESYGSRADLLKFIQNRYDELAPNGVWINRDVVGPDNPDTEIIMVLSQEDGKNEDWESTFENAEILNDNEIPTQSGQRGYLKELSTYARFLRFAQDFRKKEGDVYLFEDLKEGKIKLTLRNACEYVMKKDYVDNWQSEMHEKFCFWTYQDWVDEMTKVGFSILPQSKAYTNEWIVKNRFDGKVQFYDLSGEVLPFPVTHLLLLGEKL
jgi:hypothetical protein